MSERSSRLVVEAPFHLEATVRVLQRRPTNPVEWWTGDRYQRVLRTAGGLAVVEVEDRGTIDAPDLRLGLWGEGAPATRARLVATVRRILGLDVDPRPLRRLVERERCLRSVALALRGMRPPRFADLFEAFANVVPFQQISLEAGLAVVGRLVERFGEVLERDGKRHRAFPTAGAVAEARIDRLMACGLSRRKAECLRSIARAIASGTLREEAIAAMPTDAAIDALSELPGIGRWSAGLILLRGFGRLDVFPPGDVGATRGLGTLTRLDATELERLIERAGEFRGYLYFCALGGSLLERGLIRAAPPPPA